MKKNVLQGLILSFSLFVTATYAEQKIDPEILAEKINKVLTDFGENINVGVFVQDAKTGKVLYKKDVDRYFMPASNQKLFTAFAALRYLGPDFSYHTQLFADYKKIKKSTLNDNIYLQFSGDPTLTVPQFEFLIESLSEAGIRHIKGQAIIDDSAFDQMTLSPGSSWDDQDFCWGSPMSSLIINHNCVTATLNPAAKAGEPAKLELPDYPQTMKFINEVVTSSDKTKNCQVKVKRTDSSSYTLSGCILDKAKPQVIEMAISSPRENIRSLLNYSLKKNQISLAGGIEFKKFDAFPKAFARQDSPPLKDMVSTMLKESDNTIADALFKTMGADYAHEAGSYTNGNKAVRAILSTTLELKLPKTTLIDGAGASRYNFLKPEQIVYLLQKIFLSPESSSFISSLAIAGVDGTLKDRLNEPETRGKIYAKTGSETAVTSLAGYVETKNKQTLIFSIMINGFTEPSAKYKELEDKICKILVDAG
ncbi:D-alanyl-D-alanine carboxypeptidase DacB precursor [Legionella massiliensis]|uniref:D-alanyl-D-alanine carboxypeptidase DacB n=1 Tax=Legionella massiliensis TaxID=1034943 RepID=A0A078KVD5_9GAMM|nr:D-alanyl-D-alanine carboxypeptidase/D-alanyl-D-alanine-endopeptidase [Legionella massiliensis]CDZ76956.1 D-alanyl-D-alanine carboxypeptidase DacB precursor [Legionella massiliensis]CEE12694.1 D-alanyl-D-alanine carboxypeptidase DacB precursor [Legionella massiliensis]